MSATATTSRAPAATAWQVWLALGIVYVVWGSTYLAIRVMVETVPPLLGAAARFAFAGAVLVALVAARRGPRALRPGRRELLGALAVGAGLTGANGIIAVAERDVPSGLAALLVAAVPLWVILLRALAREPIRPAGAAAVAVGFAGVALLLLPGGSPGDVPLLGLLAVVAGSALWASASFASPRLRLPGDPLASTGWQMLLGGLVCAIAGVLAGEVGDVRPGAFSVRSLLALAYLVVFGSWIAFTAYAWLLQNAPLAKVSTYAYVNPVVAILLGWLILGEAVTALTLVGAAIIVVSVALVVRLEGGGH